MKAEAPHAALIGPLLYQFRLIWGGFFVSLDVDWTVDPRLTWLTVTETLARPSDRCQAYVMEVNLGALKALMNELNELDEDESAQRLAEVSRDDPALFEQFQLLAEGARRHAAAKDAMRDDPKQQAAIAEAAKSPRIQHLASTLGQMKGDQFGAILGRLSGLSPALAEAIRHAMFCFDDLQYAENRGVQDLIARLDKQTLRYALRAAPDEVADTLYAQMSRRAAAQLKEDIEYMGQVRRREVLAAQKTITDEARRMLKAGELIVIKPGDDDLWVK